MATMHQAFVSSSHVWVLNAAANLLCDNFSLLIPHPAAHLLGRQTGPPALLRVCVQEVGFDVVHQGCAFFWNVVIRLSETAFVVRLKHRGV